MARALVRHLAATFRDSIKSVPQPIDMDLAYQQHREYVNLLRKLVGSAAVLELPADDSHPDCCFIEDTAVVVGKSAIIARPGAPARQGEEGPVAEALQSLGYKIQHLQPPALLDGGDVLQIPNSSHILVGLTKRTNEAALSQVQQFLPDHKVHGVSVGYGLHLKSAATALDGSTLLLSDDDAGRDLSKRLAEVSALQERQTQHIMVQDSVCANVLLIDKNVVMQTSDKNTEQLLERLCAERDLQLHKLPRMEEFIKADGALTCCSILLLQH